MGQTVDIPEWRTYTGQSVEQVQGWGWLDALHPDDRDHTAVVWQKALDSRSDVSACSKAWNKRP